MERYVFPAWRYDKILFIEKKGLWPVFEAAHLAERYDLALVPEFLYCQRIHDTNMTEGLRLQALRSWWTRAAIMRRRLRPGSGLLGRRPAAVYGLMLLGLLYALGIPRVARAARLTP